MTNARDEQLYERACARLDGLERGAALPILEMLAARGRDYALIALSNIIAEDHPRRAVTLLYRAIQRGSTLAIYNLAIEYRNRGDMQRYRMLLKRSGAYGRDEARRFDLRFSYLPMKRWRRYRADR